MDRKLTDKEKNSVKRKRLLWGIGAVVVAGIAITAVAMLLESGVKRSGLTMGEVTRGPLETTVQASGRVVPAFERQIVSPVTARIVEVYRRVGDTLEAGTPILRLDLQSAETEVNRLRDSRAQQNNNVEQRRLDNETRLTSLRMQIKVKEMSVSQLRAEVANERRLDSIGSGTGDRIRQAELAYKTASIELEQLRKQLANETRALGAALANERLSLSIADRNLSDQLRTLDDAQLRSPEHATLTFVEDNVGSLVQQGQQLAVIADLSHFKIDAEISESNAPLLSPGGKAIVRIGRESYDGSIVSVTPTATAGSVKFAVRIDDDSAAKLRPGQSLDVHVVRELRGETLRIPIGPYYSKGPGEYRLFVDDGHGHIERRKVRLGDAGLEMVEVVDGLSPGEHVVLSDMSAYRRDRYRLK